MLRFWSRTNNGINDSGNKLIWRFHLFSGEGKKNHFIKFHVINYAA